MSNGEPFHFQCKTIVTAENALTILLHSIFKFQTELSSSNVKSSEFSDSGAINLGKKRLKNQTKVKNKQIVNMVQVKW